MRHREFLRDTSASVLPSFGIYRLNPTDPVTFPWLSVIANRFEQWRPLGIVFEFVSTCGDAVSSTDSSLGSVSMATQYDFYTPPFADKTQLLNHYYATSGKPSRNQMHAIECAPDKMFSDLLFTYDHSAGDLGNSDLGYTYVWREGSQAAFTAGELWVTYDIELHKPKLPPSPAGLSIHDQYRLAHPEMFPDFVVPEEKKDEERAAELAEHHQFLHILRTNDTSVRRPSRSADFSPNGELVRPALERARADEDTPHGGFQTPARSVSGDAPYYVVTAPGTPRR